MPPELPPRNEEEGPAKYTFLQVDRARNSEIYTKRTSNSKVADKQSGFFRARGSGGKVNNILKETSSTTTTEGVNTYKSEKTFPSFLRSQTKSPAKFKVPSKEGIGKENFKIIKRLG